MVCRNLYSFRTVRSLVPGAVAMGLAASTSSPARAANSGTWANAGSMSVARVGHTTTLLRNGQVLVAGGENSTNRLSSAESYNPATRKWTLAGSMATGCYSHTAVLLDNGEVLVARGIVSTSGRGITSYTATAEPYNPRRTIVPTFGDLLTAEEAGETPQPPCPKVRHFSPRSPCYS
jgi:hypothetical protein